MIFPNYSPKPFKGILKRRKQQLPLLALFYSMWNKYFESYRIQKEMQRFKRLYHLNLPITNNIFYLIPLDKIIFPPNYPKFKEFINQEHQKLFFTLGYIDYFINGEPFLITISETSCEYIYIYTYDKEQNSSNPQKYLYHLFEKIWQGKNPPADSAQVSATINIYLDEFLYALAKVSLFSPFKPKLTASPFIKKEKKQDFLFSIP